jgi:DsbC/DsbD-like thiol-disulfide interchange protein
VLFACCSIAFAVAVSASAKLEPVRVRLVTDTDRVEPGGSMHVGVLFELDPGWHIYWKNPGDAGLATEVRLRLPGGHTVGDIRWPVPIRFTQPGNLTGYGYERAVLLAAEVGLAAPPIPAGGRVNASVSWLACKDICVLGSADLAGELPLAAEPGAFEGWRASLPQAEPPFTLSVSQGLERGERRGSISIWLQWREPPAAVDFFPDSDGRFKLDDTTVRTRGGLTRIDLEAAVIEGGEANLETLPAVVVSDGSSSGRRGWRVEAPVWSHRIETLERPERR